jgi:hypothetical protein
MQSEAWLSSSSAERLYGEREAALNRTLWLNGSPYRVAGVLPPAFRFPTPQGVPDLIIPLPRADYCCARGGGPQHAIALVTNLQRFGSELPVASDSLGRDFPASNAQLRFLPVDLREHLFGPSMRALHWLLASALCLLIIAAGNGAGIWMARWLKLRRDVAIRMSLGASAFRLAAIRALEGAIAGLVAALAGSISAAVLLRVLYAVPFLNDRLHRFPCGALSLWRWLCSRLSLSWAAASV